ncbi:MAG: hypothetical protein PHH44_08670 [bacterium]|nr:hypothetical protein [bacterium]
MLKWFFKLLALPLGLGLLFLLLMGNPQPEFEPDWLRQFRFSETGECLGQVGHGVWHPHLLSSGANNAEANLPLPGDKLVPAAKVQTTRAVTIEAPAKSIWPWLMQLGYERAGWYAWSPLSGDKEYGLKIESAKQIKPEYQQLKIGDILLSGPGSNKKKGAWTVKMFYQDRALVLYSTIMGPVAVSWAFILEPIDKNSTRLVMRTRSDIGPDQQDGFNQYLVTLGDTARQRSMLEGIKERVEQRSKAKTVPLVEDQE